MHFPPVSSPSATLSAHSAFTRRETSNETLKTGGKEERNERTGEDERGKEGGGEDRVSGRARWWLVGSWAPWRREAEVG